MKINTGLLQSLLVLLNALLLINKPIANRGKL